MIAFAIPIAIAVIYGIYHDISRKKLTKDLAELEEILVDHLEAHDEAWIEEQYRNITEGFND